MENNLERKLNQKELQRIDLTGSSSDEILKFLSEKKQDGDILLAYFQDGVLWGKVDGNELIYPKTPEFNDNAFLRAHLFNESRELRVIQTPYGLKVFENTEQDNYQGDDFSFDRNYLLWGDKIASVKPEERQAGFTLLDMGQRGIRQLLPFEESDFFTQDKKFKRVVLRLRYYAKASQRDADRGNYHVYARRLLGLSIGGK